MRIPSSFKNFAANLDKDDALKCQDWVSILEAIGKLKNITSTTKEQTRIEYDETEEIRVDAPLMHDTQQNEKTHFCCLRYQIRKISLNFEKDKNGRPVLSKAHPKLLSFLDNFNFFPHSKMFSKTGNFLLKVTSYLGIKLTDLPDPEGATPSTTPPSPFL